MTPGQYTELFFWDEATALAAGHRPCAQCQYARYKQFTNLWRIANLEPEAGIETIDEYLHKERLNDEKPYFKIEDLPDGAFVSINEKPFLVYENQLYAWDFDGYTNTFRPPQDISFKTLTPLSIIKTIQSGYRPEVVFKK